jgi:membrane associated rhomboid family serine protease/HEAT repeat protein
MNDLLQPLLILVLVGSFMALRVLLRRRLLWDWPTIVMLLGMVGGSLLALFRPQGNEWAFFLVLFAFLQAELPGRLDRAALKARLRGQWELSWRWSWIALFVQPTAGRRLRLRILGWVIKARQHQLEVPDGLELLKEVEEEVDRIRNIGVSHLWHEAIFAFRAVQGRWEEIADRFSGEHYPWYAAPPSGMGLLMLEAMLRQERWFEATAILTRMEDSEERGDNAPEESDIRHNQSRLLFLAWLGEEALVKKAFERGSTLAEIVSPQQRREWLELAQKQAGRRKSFVFDDAVQEEAYHQARTLIPDLTERLDTESRLSMGSGALNNAQPATLTLVILLIACTTVVSLTGSSIDPLHLLRVGGSQLSLLQQGESWRLFTATFLHGGWVHLLFNAYFLLWFGNLVERWIGPWRFLGVYLFSGFVGFGAAMAVGTDKLIVGASGNAFGIFGAAFFLLLWLRHQLPRRWYRRQFLIAVILIVLNLYLGLSVTQISLSAHIGGFVAGFLGCALLLWVSPKVTPLVRKASVFALHLTWIALVVWSGLSLASSLQTPMKQWVLRQTRQPELSTPLLRLLALHPKAEQRLVLLRSLRKRTAEGAVVHFQLWYDKAPQVVTEVRRQLRDCGARCLPAATRLIADDDPRTRGAAILFLTNQPSPHRQAMPALLKRLEDNNLVVRSLVFDAIASFAPLTKHEEALLLPHFLSNLRSRSYFVRLSTIRLLRKVKRKPRGLTQDLAAMAVTARWGREAQEAALTLLSLGRDGQGVLMRLLFLPRLKHRKELLRAFAKHSQLPEQLPSLLLQLATRPKAPLEDMAKTLAIHAGDSLPALLKASQEQLLKPGQWRLLQKVLEHSGDISGQPGLYQKLLPWVRRGLRHHSRIWRTSLLLWLRRWGTMTGPLLPEILENLKQGNEATKTAAILALRTGEWTGPEVRKALEKTGLSAKSTALRLRAWGLLREWEGHSEKALRRYWKLLPTLKQQRVQAALFHLLQTHSRKSVYLLWQWLRSSSAENKAFWLKMMASLKSDACLLSPRFDKLWSAPQARIPILQVLRHCKLTKRERLRWWKQGFAAADSGVRLTALRWVYAQAKASKHPALWYLRARCKESKRACQKGWQQYQNPQQQKQLRKQTEAMLLTWLSRGTGSEQRRAIRLLASASLSLHHLKTLQSALTQKRPMMVAQLLKQLRTPPTARPGLQKALLPILRGLLNSKEPFVPESALKTLAVFAPETTLPQLMKGLKNEQQSVVERSAEALSLLLKQKKWRQHIVKKLRLELYQRLYHSPHRKALVPVFVALKRELTDDDYYRLVRFVMRSGKKEEWSVPLEILTQLRRAEPHALKMIFHYLHFPKSKRLPGIARLLLALGDKAGALFTKLALCDKRCASARFYVLSKLNEQRLPLSWLPGLEILLLRESPYLLEVWKALERLGKPGRPLLFRALRSTNPKLRARALRSLFKQRLSVREQTQLRPLFADRSPLVVAALRRSLGNVRRPSEELLAYWKGWQGQGRSWQHQHALSASLCQLELRRGKAGLCLRWLLASRWQKTPGLWWPNSIPVLNFLALHSKRQRKFNKAWKMLTAQGLQFWKRHQHPGKTRQLLSLLLDQASNRAPVANKALLWTRKISEMKRLPQTDSANLAEALLHAAKKPGDKRWKEAAALARSVQQRSVLPSLQLPMLHLLWMQAVLTKKKQRTACKLWVTAAKRWPWERLGWSFKATRVWLQTQPSSVQKQIRPSLLLLEKPFSLQRFQQQKVCR